MEGGAFSRKRLGNGLSHSIFEYFRTFGQKTPLLRPDTISGKLRMKRQHHIVFNPVEYRPQPDRSILDIAVLSQPHIFRHERGRAAFDEGELIGIDSHPATSCLFDHVGCLS